jgi:hypothetical protein
MKFESITTYNESGKAHSFEDRPSIMIRDSATAWTKDNEYHREDGPAIIHKRGAKRWYLNSWSYGNGDEPPEKYLEKLEELGIEFVRGSDEV